MAQGKRVTAELGVLIKANNKLSGQVQKARRDVSSFKQQLKGLGSVIAGAFAIGAVVNFTKASIRAFDIQAKAQASLLVALKGNVEEQQELIAQAKILQKTTLFGDEATIQAQAMLASMGLQVKEIKKLIPLVQDFATLQKLDLSTAANLVAKSVGSSTNALTRYGIQIEGAVGSSERLESAVKAMNEKVGGQAAAAAKVGAGELQQLSNLWEDFTETIGFVIAKGLIPLAAHLKEVVSDLDVMLSLLSGQQTLDQTETQLAKLNKELNKTTEELIRAVTTDPDSLGVFMFNPNNPATIGTLRREIKRLKDEISELGGEIQKAAPLPDFFGLQKTFDESVKLGDAIDEQLLPAINTLNISSEDLSNTYKTLALSTDQFRAAAERAIKQVEDLDTSIENFNKDVDFEPIDIPDISPELSQATKDIISLRDAVESYNKMAGNMTQRTLDMAIIVSQAITDMKNIFVAGIGEMIGSLLATGNVAASLTSAFLIPLADLAIQVGKTAIAIGIGIAGIKKALQTLNPIVAIVAGIALITLGTFAKSALAKSGKQIKGFARGVQNFEGGLAIVGERGPELLDIPRGSNIIPNNKIGGFGGNLTIVVEGNLIGTEHELGRVVTNALARFNQNRG